MSSRRTIRTRRRRGRRTAAVAVAGLTVLGGGAAVRAASVGPQQAAPAPVQARLAGAFVDSIGVNTHFGYGGGVYDTGYTTLVSKLRELGLRHVRDGSASAYARLKDLYDATGVRSTMIVDARPGGDRGKPLDAAGIPAQLADIARTQGPAVEALEAPNEYDISHPGTDGDWAATLRRFVTALHADAAANGALAGRPVLGPSLTSEQAYRDVGDLTSTIDVVNVHHYLGGHNPGTGGWGGDGYGSIPWVFSHLKNRQSPSRPLQITESGYHSAVTSGNGHRGTPEAVEAKYLPRMFLEYFRAGVQRAFKYELADQGTDKGDLEQNFGLLRRDLSEKPAFTALKNLIGLLADRGCTTAPGQLAYGLGGAPDDVHQLLLGRCDGSFDVVLWREADTYDPNTHAVSTVAAAPVTLDLARAADVKVYDPLRSAAPVSSDAATAAVRLSVPDSPLVVHVGGGAKSEPAPSASPSPSTSPSPSMSPSPSTSPSPSGTPSPTAPPGTVVPVRWRLNGAATRQQGGVLVLTPAEQGRAGSALARRLVPTQGLHVAFDVEASGGTGGDGLTLALLDPATPATSVGGTGGDLGVANLPGRAVTLDTFSNPGEPAGPFAGLLRTGYQPGYAATSAPLPGLRTGSHHVEVSTGNGRIAVAVDGRTVLDAAADLPPSVRLGFTAATGGLTDRHVVTNVTVRRS